MELALETRSPSEARADVLVLGQYGDGARPAPEIATLDRALGGLLSRVLKTEKFEGKPGQISYVHTAGAIPAERVLVVGLGPLRHLPTIKQSLQSRLRHRRRPLTVLP